MNLIQKIKFAFLPFILTLIRVPCCDSSEVTVEASKKPATSGVVAPWNKNSVTALATSGPGENFTANSTVDKNYPWKDRKEEDVDMPCENDAECVANYGKDFYCLAVGKLEVNTTEAKKCDCYSYTKPVTVEIGENCPCKMKDGRVYIKWVREDDGICRLSDGEICRIGFPDDECRKIGLWGELLYCKPFKTFDGIEYGKCSSSKEEEVAGAYSHVGESILILSIPTFLLFFRFGMI